MTDGGMYSFIDTGEEEREEVQFGMNLQVSR